MTSFDLLEALTDMEDEVLLRAEADPPKRRRKAFRPLRTAVAACLVVVFALTALVATDAIAVQNNFRWTIRYRDDKVTYLFKGGEEQDGPLPCYEPTWLPACYVLNQESTGPERHRSLSYWKPSADPGWIIFNYTQITDKDVLYLGSLAKGTYETDYVTIGELPGQLYTYLEEPNSGTLVWIDKEHCIVFYLGFDTGAEEAVRMAESVRLMEEE